MIRVVTLAEFDPDTITLLLRKLQAAYGAGAELSRKATLPAEAYVKASQTYDAVKLVAEAEDVRTFGDDKILFLTDRPLSLPIGPMGDGPVDGFADDGGVKCVVTTAGLGGKNALPLPEGLAKRSARHIGHLFGLHHCYEAKCAMLPGWAEAFSQNPETSLCPYCREKSERRIFRA